MRSGRWSRKEVYEGHLWGILLVALQEPTHDNASHAVTNEDNSFMFLENFVITKDETHVFDQFVYRVAVTEIGTRVRIDVHISVLEFGILAKHLRPIGAAASVCPRPHSTAEDTMYEDDYGVGVRSPDILRVNVVCARFSGRWLLGVTRIRQRERQKNRRDKC